MVMSINASFTAHDDFKSHISGVSPYGICLLSTPTGLYITYAWLNTHAVEPHFDVHEI